MTDEDNRPPAVRAADYAYASFDALEAAVRMEPFPGPVAYDVLTNLHAMAGRLPDLLELITARLARSLDEFNTYSDNGGDPLQIVATASDHISRARQLSVQLNEELEQAAIAVRGLGYRGPQ